MIRVYVIIGRKLTNIETETIILGYVILGRLPIDGRHPFIGHIIEERGMNVGWRRIRQPKCKLTYNQYILFDDVECGTNA
jgi:hypothetical protein